MVLVLVWSSFLLLGSTDGVRPYMEEGRVHTIVSSQSPGASPSTSTTDTLETKSRQPDLAELVLATPGTVVLIRFGVVLLAAFIAGAFVQRVVTGTFALKLGALELAPIPAEHVAQPARTAIEYLSGRGFRMAATSELLVRYQQISNPRLILVTFAADLRLRVLHLRLLREIGVVFLLPAIEALLVVADRVVLECRAVDRSVLLIVREVAPTLLTRLDGFLNEYRSRLEDMPGPGPIAPLT